MDWWIEPNAMVSYENVNSHDTTFHSYNRLLKPDLLKSSRGNYNTSLPPSNILRTEFSRARVFCWKRSESAAGDEDGEAGDGRQRPDGGRGPEIRGHAPDVGGAWGRRPTERDEQILKCIDTTLWFQLILISFTEIQLSNKTSKNQSYWSDVLRWCLSKFTVNLSVSTFERN